MYWNVCKSMSSRKKPISKHKRGLLSETPFPLAKKPLTLAGSHPSNTDNDGEAAKPQPINASAGHRNIEYNVAVPNEVCLC